MCQFWGITNQIGRFEGLGIPFAINPSAYADYCSFYQLSDIDNEKSEIVLSKIDDQTIESGTSACASHYRSEREKFFLIIDTMFLGGGKETAV